MGSAGVRKGELDPFAVAAMDEIGIDIAKHKPMTFEELEEWEGLNFDLIVTLSPEAHHKALELTRTLAAESNTGRPPIRPPVEGNREQRLDAYRAVRDQLHGADPRSASAASQAATNRAQCLSRNLRRNSRESNADRCKPPAALACVPAAHRAVRRRADARARPLGLPKGKLNSGEDALTAAKREVLEETGH